VAFFNSRFRRTVLWRTLEIATITTVISVWCRVLDRLCRGARAAALKSDPDHRRRVSAADRRDRALLRLADPAGPNGLVNGTLIWGLGSPMTPFAMLYTQGSVIVAMVYLFVPLMILTLVGVLETIPNDVMQAAASLGATPAATFRQVIFPLAVPGLIVGAVLVFTGSFTAYATPQLLGGDRQMMMGTLLHQQAMVAFDWPGPRPWRRSWWW
jgi:putative spermidine/putrescine transport system permease protein